MSISIVPTNAIKGDPRQLLFHYPSMTAIRYAKLASQFYHWRTVQICEEMARIQNFLLVPSNVIHWRRKSEITEDRKIKIGKHMYYLLRKSEMTDNEIKKLQEYVQGEISASDAV